jgi:hypothetical protein
MSSRVLGAALAAGKPDLVVPEVEVTAADAAGLVLVERARLGLLDDGDTGPITAADVALEAAVERIEAQLTDAGPAPVMPRHQPVRLAADGWPQFCIDEVDLEDGRDRAFRQAVEVARTHDRLDRVVNSVDVAATQATGDADRLADLLDDVLVELREANRLASRSWWARLRGAR